MKETVSGKKDWNKRKLDELHDKLIKGDTIITFESNRLGRDFKQTIKILASCNRKIVTVICGDIKGNSVESNIQMFFASMTAEQKRKI